MAERKPFVWGASGVELLQTGDTLAGASSSGAVFSLLSTATISTPVSAVEFTGLTDEYFKYIIEIDNAQASTDPDAQFVVMQAYNDGAWITSASYYGNMITDNAGTYYYNNYIASTSGSNKIFSGTIEITNPAQSKLSHLIKSRTLSYYENAGSVSTGSGSFWDRGMLIRVPSYSTITGVRILGTVGDLLAGTFKLYGVNA